MPAEIIPSSEQVTADQREDTLELMCGCQARRWRDRASARTDQEGGRHAAAAKDVMVRVRQHQENMWLGGLRRDRAVDQQESHTERPHRRHDRPIVDLLAATASRDRARRAAARCAALVRMMPCC